MIDSINIPFELVDVGDMRLAVREAGTGPVVVWLHGSGPGASGLSNFRANLPAFADFRNIIIDLPRFGNSDRPHLDGDLVAHASERVIRALDTLGVTSFSLIGNSFGGAIAARIAGTHPARVPALLLMAPGGIPLEGPLPVGLKILLSAMRDTPDERVMRAFVSAQVFDQSLVTDDLVHERLTAALRNHPELEGIPIIGSVQDVLPNIEAATLLIWGRHDKFIPVEHAQRWVQALPEADLHIFASCAHWAQRERSDDFNSLARDLLARAHSNV